MTEHKILNKVLATLVFILAFFVFFSTMAPTVSFWDCGEYIASCYTLGIPHPPGNPFFILLGRVFTMIMDTEQVAFRVNFISVVTGAFSALFLYLIVVRAVIGAIGQPDELWKKVVTYVGGIVGACFGVFNYTFWFSAIEASVYIPSILTIIINVYIALVWAQSKDKNRDRYLLLFSYLSFLGVGIHMMALFSLIPIFVYVLLVDKEKRFDWRVWGVAFILGSVAYDVSSFIIVVPLVLVVALAMISYLPKNVGAVAALIYTCFAFIYRLTLPETELTGDKEAGLFKTLFNVGMFVLPYLIIVAIATVDLIIETAKEKRNYSWKFCFYVTLFALIGYSVHLYIPIRSTLEPMIDENHPVVRLHNDGKALKAHKEFISALEDEAKVKESAAAFISAVKQDSTLDESYAKFNNLLRKLEVSEGNSNVALRKYNEAIASDSMLTIEKQLFDSLMATDLMVEKAYKDFLLAAESKSDNKVISNKFEAFKQSLRSNDLIKKGYITFVKKVKAQKSANKAYLAFINSFKLESIANAYAAFRKDVAANKDVKALEDKYLNELKHNEDLFAKYNTFLSDLKGENQSTRSSFLELQSAIDSEQGPVEASYYTFLDAVEKDSLGNHKLIAYEDEVKLNYVAKPLYEDFLAHVDSTTELKKEFERFTSVLATNADIQDKYKDFEKMMGSWALNKIKWDKFKGFLERKQYGSESMITRAFHRRGAFNTQFGIDGHMGLLGFHITQFYHFGDSVRNDREGSGEDNLGTKRDNQEIARRNQLLPKSKQIPLKPLPSEKNNVLSGNIFSRFGYILVYLIPTFFVLFGMGYWMGPAILNFVKTVGGRSQFTSDKQGLDPKAGVLFFLLVLSTTIGFAVYMNFADGTRPDSAKDVKRHEERYEYEYKMYKQQLDQWKYINNNWDQLEAEYRKRGQSLPQEWRVRPEAPRKEAKPVHREVRIRDYFYTAGFTFFGLWVGLSAVALLHFLFTSKGDTIKSKIAYLVAGLLLFSVAIPIYSNYEEHDRTHDWIPYDYARNLLESCKKNAILFTNGDNDTFPLWFLQEAEGIRPDVRVVNFSLLNTPWYIRQLQRLEPKVPISYTNYEIEPRTEEANLPGVRSFADWQHRMEVSGKLEPVSNPYGRFEDAPKDTLLKKAGIRLNPPTAQQQGYFTIANLLVHDIINENQWRKPIYFTVNTPTVSLMGTEPYLEIQGMVQELKRNKVPYDKKLNLEITKHLLDSVYQFRVFEDDTKVTISETAEKTARNYAYVFFRFTDVYSGYGIVDNLRRHIAEIDRNVFRLEQEIKRLQDDFIKPNMNKTDAKSQQTLSQATQLVSKYRNDLSSLQVRKISIEIDFEREVKKFKEKLPEVMPYLDRAIRIYPDIDRGVNRKEDYLSIANTRFDKKKPAKPAAPVVPVVKADSVVNVDSSEEKKDSTQ